jgi:hypothetical protein
VQLNIQTVQQRTDLEPQLTKLATMLSADYDKIDKTAVRSHLFKSIGQLICTRGLRSWLCWFVRTALHSVLSWSVA